MLLSPAQQAKFWKLWTGACAAQGWQGDEKELRRREVLRDLGFSSLKLVDKEGGFDRVKAHLLRLQDRLEGASEEVFPSVGEMRRHVYLIRSKLVPALAARVSDPDAYIRAICRDKFGHSGPWESLGAHPERGPAQIRQLLLTLTRCLYGMGWTEPARVRDGRV